MTIADIVIKTDDDYKFDPFKENIEYKKVDFGHYYIEGFFKSGTKTAHGMGRITIKNDSVKEGMFFNGQFTGYGRFIQSDRYIIGQWRNSKLNGYAKLVFTSNGNFVEGIFIDDIY